MKPQPRSTRRIVVRPYRLSDYAAWRRSWQERAAVAGNDAEPGPRELTTQAFRAWVSQHRRGATEDVYYPLGIFHRRSGRWLGGIDLLVVLRLDAQLGYLGYFLHEQHWNKGYATEALPLAFEVAFDDLHLHRLEASIRPENRRSIRLAKRVGMRRECVRKSWSWDDDERWADHVIFVKTGSNAPPRIRPLLRDILRPPR